MPVIQTITSYVIAGPYLGSWILYEGCAVFPDLPLSGNCILRGRLLCCWHFEQALIGYLHKVLSTDKEIPTPQEACWQRDSSRCLKEKNPTGEGEGRRETQFLSFDTD